MSEQRIAGRYAKALIASVGKKNLQMLDKDLSLAEALWDKSPVVRAWFLNPAIKKEERVKKIDGLIRGLDFSATMKKFFQLLAVKNRLNLLPEIIRIAKELSDQVQGRVRTEIITAGEIRKERLDAIKSALEEKTKLEVILNTKKDTGIIGGAILKIKGTVFDGSLITRLNRLKEKLKEEEHGITSG
jgi:F-type H+-transporting ATPase subunit delta